MLIAEARSSHGQGSSERREASPEASNVSSPHQNDYADRHHHDHGGHRHAQRGGIGRLLASVFTRHSHDAPEAVDTALETKRRRSSGIEDLPRRVGTDRPGAARGRHGERLGGVARRHRPQLCRRAHRGAARRRVLARSSPCDPPIHLWVWTRRGPRGDLHRRHDRSVSCGSGVRSTGSSTLATCTTSDG